MSTDDARFERDRVRGLLRARLFGTDVAPARLGRFEVRARIGQGATGVVYRAFDPKLAREVALKLLGGAPGRRLMTRLESEGRALAKLSHPNVVQIHDVGEHEGEVFLAMQLVAGTDLRSWLAERERTDAEIVAVLLDAGRGLAAAHRQGLVHRDFKPENVLVGERGGVVADFGLAALTTLEEQPAGPASALGTTPAGTPAYMAPEQWAGGPVDARTDQYAFGLVLLEALGRARAPLGDRRPPSPERIARAIASLPRRHRPTVARALAHEARDRFESMDALIEALAARETSNRRRGTLVLAGVVLALGAAVLAARLAGTGSPCPDDPERWRDVWDEGRRARLETVFRASELPFAPRALETTLAALDAYRARWSRARVAVCEATAVRHEQSEVLLDTRMACLERARRDARAGIDALLQGDASSVIRADRVVSDLPAPDACRAVFEDERSHVASTGEAAIEQDLARARAALSAGHFDEGAALAEGATTAAHRAHTTSLEAEAWVVLGRVQHERGVYAAAEASLVRGVALAISAGSPRVAAMGAVALVETYAVGLSRYADAAHWADLADAHLGERSDAGATRADLMLARGELYRNMYRADDAVAALTEAVELHRTVYGAESPRLATAMTRLGMARFDTRGCAWIEEALVLRERVLGPGHPDLGDSYDRLASCAVNANDPDRAAELHTRALELRRAALGPDHRDVARSCFNFAWLRLNQGRFEDAEVLYECARRIYARIGNRHFEAASLIGVADVRMRQGRLDEAETLLASAGAIYRETVPREHGSVARLEMQLARLALLRGAAAEARAHDEEALRISQATHEVGVETLALEGAGRAALARGRPAEARTFFETALARLTPTDAHGLAGATLRFRLAQVRVAEDPAATSEARTIAQSARAEIASSPAAWSAGSIVSEIDAWLRDTGSGAIGVGRSARWADGAGVRGTRP